MIKIFKAPPIQLSESFEQSNLKKMQILKVGDFFHDAYGNFKITKKMLSEMVSNFEAGVRGVVPALDYSHNSEDVAAGWFKKLFLQSNESELWADVEMTPKGSKVLSEKEFGYTSAEFDPDYESNEIPKKKYGAVLLGAALTNRPVIKNMKSVIELSEGGKMDIKELEEKLAEYGEKDKKFSESEEAMKKLMEAAGVDSVEKIIEMIAAQKPAELSEEEKKKLAEKDEELEMVKKELGETKEKLELSEKKKTAAEKESKFTIMLSEGKVCVAQKEAFMNGNMEEFAKNAQTMNLSEQGHGKSPKDDGKDPTDKILELANEMVVSKKISLSEAIATVRKENPELVKKLQEKK